MKDIGRLCEKRVQPWIHVPLRDRHLLVQERHHPGKDWNACRRTARYIQRRVRVAESVDAVAIRADQVPVMVYRRAKRYVRHIPHGIAGRTCAGLPHWLSE